VLLICSIWSHSLNHFDSRMLRHEAAQLTSQYLAFCSQGTDRKGDNSRAWERSSAPTCQRKQPKGWKERSAANEQCPFPPESQARTATYSGDPAEFAAG
jgi:hypothetical protein